MSLKAIKDAEANVKELTVTIGADPFKEAILKVYNKQKKSISLPGFRKGKAPMHLIEKMYGESVFFEDAIDDLFPSAVDEAVKEAGIENMVASPYDANIVSMSKADGVEFTIKVAVAPEVDPGEYKGLEAHKHAVEVTDEDIDHEIGHLREQNSRIIDVDDRAAAMDDTVVIDFDGYCDGEQFEGGKAEDYSLVLGSGTFIPGFEEQIVGKNIGDEFDVDVTFPEQYTPELAGKPAVFKCKLKSISVKELPEADDEFAKDLGEYDTIAELREGIKAEMLEHRQHHADDDFENELRDKLVEIMKADVPEIMIKEQAQQNKENFIRRMESQGISIDNYYMYTGTTEADLDERIEEEAAKQVKLRLSLEAIAKAEGIEASEEEIEAEYDKIATTYGIDKETVKKLAPEDGVKGDVVVQKAMKVVVDNAVAKEEEPEAEKAESDEA